MVGYSFGSIIAIELTRRLEAMNFKGRLILIDGAPEQMRMMYKDFMSDSKDVDLQILVLTSIMEINSPGSSEKVIFSRIYIKINLYYVYLCVYVYYCIYSLGESVSIFFCLMILYFNPSFSVL